MTTKDRKKTLITTAIDYTNDVIHIGHAYQKILADCLVRFERLKKGDSNVYFLTGTDEFGTTNEKAAIARNLSPKEHVDDIVKKDKEQFAALNISYNRFIRTTDADHQKIATEFYSKVLAKGDIYKGTYTGLYCESCESYKTLSELNEQGQCQIHYYKKIQEVKEENWFFRWSKYSEYLKEFVNKKGSVLPAGKWREMAAFIEGGIKDIPVTRPKYKVSWGITAPNDPEQVIYVWFDALINYYTAGSQTGFWDDNTRIIHILGKDNAKWHVLLWPAMLKSAELKVPDTVYVHSFINLEGQKISKSLGNIIRPTDLVSKYGTDAVRYYFLKHGPIVEDVDISLKHLEEVYNSDLANGLGNTVARIAKLAENSKLEFETYDPRFAQTNSVLLLDLYLGEDANVLKRYRVDFALQDLWKRLAALDKHINENKPWSIKDSTKLKEILQHEINEIRIIAKCLEPFIPATSKIIQEQFKNAVIEVQKPLFPRM